MDHPRARVAQEERGRGLPGWLLRVVYRPLIPGTVKRFANAMSSYEPGMQATDGDAVTSETARPHSS
jgi:hypothetical protein